MKRFFALLSISLLLALPGCGGKAGKDFTAVLPGDVTSLDPQTASGVSASIVIGSIFEGLCRVGPDSQPLPGVAERWTHNRDHTEFTFRLRKARWSDGTPVTADDFVFGVTRALSPETGAASPEDLFLIENARAFHEGQTGPEVLGIAAEDDRTLVFRLETGYPDFPLLTAGNHYMPCNRAYFEESAGHYGLSAEYTLTNGPFTFPSIYAWDTDYNERSVTLVKANEYRGERKAAAASLTYLIDYDSAIDEDPVGSLGRGDVDLLELSEEQARQAEEAGCTVLSLDDGVAGLLLNPRADALNNAAIRELFFKTLDRQELLDRGATVLMGEAYGVMPRCVLSNGDSYYAEGETCYPLQDDGVLAGIPSLLEMLERSAVPSITVLCPDDQRSIDMANSLLMSWNSKLGTAFNILPLPESEVKSRVANGDYEAALYTLWAGGATPFDVLKNFAGTASLSMEDPEYDSALANLSFTPEGFRELEGTLRDLYVFYPLLTAQSYYALAPGTSGIAVSPDDRWDFSQARKK